MSADETTPQESESSETPPSNVPADFAGYVKWRKTGEPPAEPESKPEPAAAAEEEPLPAKSEPQSGAEEPQQTEEEEEEQGEPQNATGRRNGRQRKIDRLTRELAELKAQLAAAAQPKPQEPPKPEPPAGKPRLETFETLEAYQEALTDWNITQRENKRQAEADAKAAQEAEQKLQADWQSRQQAARKAHPDYDDVIESTAAPDGPGVMAGRQAMLEDEAGAEILYYLGTHPDELKRIAASQPIAAVREIGRLSAILSPPSAPNGKQRFTAAPKPPPGTTRPAKAMSDSIDDPAVLNDFPRWAKARMKGK